MSMTPDHLAEPDEAPLTPAAVQVLVDNHRRFLAFLEKRVRSREVAEDILQEAFVRGVQKAPAEADAGSVTAWFYRVLRNALIDHYRRRGVEQRVLEPEGDAGVPERSTMDPSDPERSNFGWTAPDQELMDTVCRCVGALVETIKPEYAEAIRRVDLDGEPVRDYATAAGISANNASVRLHRAHAALRAQVARSCGTCADHGCLDCSCGRPKQRAATP
jgi:RNA polymerase sigma factor (sigma-70 family)